MGNKEKFIDSEANEWFRRNHQPPEQRQPDEDMILLSAWLQPFKNEIDNIIEIGCGDGRRLVQMTESLNANGYGVEPSVEAVDYIDNNLPTINAKVGFGDNIPFDKSFDLVHLGFFLYLVDRENFLRCVSEADRLVKPGGFLSITDFETTYPYSNDYSHRAGIYSHKHNNTDVFVASGLYSVVNKFHFSHKDFFFDKDINERVSLTLLYKEMNIFRG
ncbi:MAG: class I SAM-dependent methyltransferase [Pseudomonadales bacterium]